MNNEFNSKLQILSEIFPDYQLYKNEINTYCPVCLHHKKKLVISLEKDIFHCWVCNYSGKTYQLIKIYGTELLYQQWREISGSYLDVNSDLKKLLNYDVESIKHKQKIITLPIEARKLRNNIPSLIAKKCIQFLNNRRISYDLVRTYNFYFCEEGKFQDRIIIPSYDNNGRINFFVTRSIYNSEEIKKYINSETAREDVVFNELFITWAKPIILVEGPFDCFSINRNTIPLLGTAFNEKFILFKKIVKYKPEVILMLDNDDAGRNGTREIGKLLQQWGINISIIDYPEKDPGEIESYSLIQKYLKNKRKFEEREIMKGLLE